MNLSLKMNFGFEYTQINIITPINAVFIDEFMEIKMGFDGSLHTKFSKIWSSNTVDGSLYPWTCKLEFDHLEALQNFSNYSMML